MNKRNRSSDLAIESHPPASDDAFPIVGIGASAGGLEPVTEFLRSVPADTGMAFVIVQHLDPHHTSALSSILAKSTKMKVSEAKDGVIVCPNEVYVIAPATEMILADGRLRVTPRPATRAPQMPIDTFMISLAAQRGSRSAGVVLSGTGTDGTRGLQAIHAAGGITFAQDSTATHDGMPRHAMSAGCVDFVLPSELIAQEISLRPPGNRDGSQWIALEDEKTFENILKLLNKASGIDFVNYKIPTMRRRVERRMAILRIDTLKAYLDRLSTDPSELKSVEEEVLIHVTSFFRDPETFEALKTTVLPSLIANLPDGEELRIWVPGCSSGEEVYSIVICLIEYFESQNLTITIKAFATDVSERAIEKARTGLLPKNISDAVSAERLLRFFKQSDAGYQIVKAVRDCCVFARQDITQDPPFSQIDLISCRNVLIYLGPILHSRVFPIFHYALKPDGFLILGSAESVGGFAELFEPVDKQRRFYQRTKASSRIAVNFATGRPFRATLFSSSTSTDPALRGYDVRDVADRVVLSRYAPSGVVVDEFWSVVQFRGHTGRFLEPPPGLPSYDLLQMARQGLLPSLRSALEAARVSGLPARQENVRLDDFLIHLEVIPITVPPTGQRYFVALFEESPEFREASTPLRSPAATADEIETELAQTNARLREELAATKAYLQSVIEAKDVTNEELRAANEEVISSNEELQSTNEELETAKEELQSTNEELETVNEELESRIRTTIQLNDELTNLITCVRIPILIVGQDLRVRRFSQRAGDVFNLLSGDIGRLVTDLTLRINVPDLRSLILNVLDTLEVHEQEVTDLTGHWYTLSIRPFRTSDNKIDGAIILLIDINASKEREQVIIEARDFARNIIGTLHESLLVLDHEMRVQEANHAFYETFRVAPEAVVNQSLFSLGGGQWDIPELRALLEQVLRSDGDLVDIKIDREFSGIGRRTIVLNARRFKNEFVANLSQTILLAIDDITTREEALRSLKKTELLMQSIVENAFNAINEQRNVLTFNHAAEAMFGYEAADVIGTNVNRLIPQFYFDEHGRHRQQYFDSGLRQFIGSRNVVFGIRKDGTTFPAELGFSEIKDSDERLFTGILVDISERCALEREVLAIANNEQQRIGQDLHDTTGQELTGMSYMAQSLADALRAKKLPEADKAARLVTGMEAALKQLRSIVRGLIPVEVDSQGLTTALEALATRTSESSHIPCEFQCEHDLLLEDTRIATQLFLIAREAVNNCIKHSRPGRIQIRLAAIDSDVVLQVCDDGIGINDAGNSKGVGIHIMGYRANAMGGTIKFEPGEDGGTVLICRLPLSNSNATLPGSLN